MAFGLAKLEETERQRLKKLFERETGREDNFNQLREQGYTGYTHCYLHDKLDIHALKTTASLEIVMDIVKLDLAEGAKPEEIVFGCCWGWPKKDVISLVIYATGAKIEDVLKYEDNVGNNCLTTAITVLIIYYTKTGKDPAGTAWAREVEEVVEYLIELGEKQGLEVNKILEKTNKSGGTLFMVTSLYLQDLASSLLARGIIVKSIDAKFLTPSFKFVSLHRPMIAAGVNPYALDYRNSTQADDWNVSKKLISELNPGLTPDLYYSTTSLPCNDKTCDLSCQQGLPDPWYYNNGRICDFKEEHRIGKGAEGAVFSGSFHGQKAAFKFIEIKNLKYNENPLDTVFDLKKRLTEMEKLSGTFGRNILPFYGHIRQQLSAEKVKELRLGDKVTRYEVYITKICDFNLADLKRDGLIDIAAAKILIDRMEHIEKKAKIDFFQTVCIVVH